MRATWTLAVLAPLACAEDVTRIRETPAWVGTYSLIADSSSYCEEVQDPNGRRCVCGPSGYYEGTLSLVADDTGAVGGALVIQECRPGNNPECGNSTSYGVGPFTGPFPPPGVELPPAWIRFCANGCLYGSNGGWNFMVPSQGSNLVGRYSRGDGNIRGCGSDYGPFTAVRQ